MTEQENLRIALEGGKTEGVPCFWGGGQLVVSSVIGNLPSFERPEGYDWFGVHWTASENAGGMFSPTAGIKPVLEDVTKWKEIISFADLESIDWGAAAKRDTANLDPNKLTNFYGMANGIFERLHFLMGFEEAMMAIMEEPKAVNELLGAITDFYVKIIEKVGKYYKPEYLTLLDDYAHKTGTFISPAMFDELFAPHLKRIVDATEYNGMKFILHCCGKMQILLDNFVKIGIKRFDPCQPVNDLADMRLRYPEIGLMGGLDIQRVIDYPGVTEKQLRAEIRRCIDEYGPLGGYAIYGASVSMYNPKEYAPNGKMGIIIDEALRYSKR